MVLRRNCPDLVTLGVLVQGEEGATSTAVAAQAIKKKGLPSVNDRTQALKVQRVR